MSAVVLDAGALVAVDRDERAMIARLAVARAHGLDLRSHAMVVAQVWRDPSGRQARLASLLKAVDVKTLDEPLGREAGVLLSAAGLDDPIDAALVLVADHGDRIVTGDPDDVEHLARVAGRAVTVVRS